MEQHHNETKIEFDLEDRVLKNKILQFIKNQVDKNEPSNFDFLSSTFIDKMKIEENIKTEEDISSFLNHYENVIKESLNYTSHHIKELTIAIQKFENEYETLSIKNKEFFTNNQSQPSILNLKTQVFNLNNSYVEDNKILLSLIKQIIKEKSDSKTLKHEYDDKIHEIIKNLTGNLELQINLNSKLYENNILDSKILDDRRKFLERLKSDIEHKFLNSDNQNNNQIIINYTLPQMVENFNEIVDKTILTVDRNADEQSTILHMELDKRLRDNESRINYQDVEIEQEKVEAENKKLNELMSILSRLKREKDEKERINNELKESVNKKLWEIKLKTDAFKQRDRDYTKKSVWQILFLMLVLSGLIFYVFFFNEN